ncbi:MAG: hypothetical protein ABIH20_05845 [Candidatus Diapherotrites archaeon]
MTKYTVAGRNNLYVFDAPSDEEAVVFSAVNFGNKTLVRPDGAILPVLRLDVETKAEYRHQGIDKKFEYHTIPHPKRGLISPIEVVAQTGLNSRGYEPPITAKIDKVVEGLRTLYAHHIEEGKAPVELFEPLIKEAEEMRMVKREGDLLILII